MDLKLAQREVAIANLGGAPGVLVSGIAWLVAGGVWLRADVTAAFAVLFVGGMLIVPVSLLVSQTLARAPKASPDNPLNQLGIESTVILFAGIFVAYCLLRAAPGLVFPVMAITIGARYFVFRTIYGQVLYWGLGTALLMLGVGASLGWFVLPGNLALATGIVEVGFSAVLFFRHRAAPARGT